MNSNLRKKASSKLMSPYNVMTTFFFRRSVEKAFQLDEPPSGLSLSLNKPIDGAAPYISSAVDDIMYIVNTVLTKSLSTCQRDVIASVIPTVSRVLGADFVGMIQRKMRDESYPRAATQGGFPPEDKIISFIVQINSLDMANEYLDRIIAKKLEMDADRPTNGMASTTQQLSPLKQSFPFEHDVTLVTQSFNALNSSFTSKTSELLNDGLQVLFNQVVKPRLRPVLSDTFRDADYTLSEKELAEIAQENDEEVENFLEQVPRRFEHGWDALMKPIGRLMTPRTSTTLLSITTTYLARVLESRVWKAGRVSGQGAVRMERDFSAIVGIVSRGNYAMREPFTKVLQILMVANMEDDEWEEIGADDADESVQWVLSDAEKTKARSLVRG
jgi:conserved oligomeric Golgi complex subunit 4